jgi:hypothetical protein
MKKLALTWVSGVVIFAGVVLALVSCSVDPSVKRSESVTVARDGSNITEVTFKGHEYLAFDCDHGGSLCHSETCPCKSSK